MAEIILQLACSDGQTQSFTIAMQELRFVKVCELAEQMLDQRTPKQILDQVIYVDDDGDRCTLSCEASMTDALTFCKQGTLLLELEIVGDKHAAQVSPFETQQGRTLIEFESICSETECDVLYVGGQDDFAATDIGRGDRQSDFQEESLQVSRNSIASAAAVTHVEKQSSNVPILVQMDGEDALAASTFIGEKGKVFQLVTLGFSETDARKALAEASDDVRTAAANLCGISELVSMGWSKSHAEIALAAAGGDVNVAAACLTSATRLFSKYDRELVMRVLGEQEGDVESVSRVLHGICQHTQPHRENGVSQGIPTVTSSMKLAIAELGLHFENFGDTVISSASKAMDKIHVQLGKAMEGATASRGFLKRRSRVSRTQNRFSTGRRGARHSASSTSCG
eukprot:TRINITY_DN29566_c0_g1_i1.p1 TRINITY_DN29566_c0_g1~~TRINITY_DN29566_c0_g1_i1.p1  ORF type:complete len:408 (-),score=101.06 TRINITY_DN29566_c0_g1_i1:52-1242(-)